MRIVSDLFPWTFSVIASDWTAGVTCGEVIDTLAKNFFRHASREDYYDTLSTQRQKRVSEVYRYNRSTAYGRGTLGEGLRRLDFLGKDTTYGGILLDEAALRRRCGDVLPCMFVLNCQRYVLTQEEMREQEEIRKQEEIREQEEIRKQEEIREQEAKRAAEAEAEENMRRATVATDSEIKYQRRPVAPGSLSPDEELVKVRQVLCA
jgi:hypothetical protein